MTGYKSSTYLSATDFFLLSCNDRGTRKAIFCFCCDSFQADPLFATNLLKSHFELRIIVLYLFSYDS